MYPLIPARTRTADQPMKVTVTPLALIEVDVNGMPPC
jgi:hypothetical protein